MVALPHRKEAGTYLFYGPDGTVERVSLNGLSETADGPFVAFEALYVHEEKTHVLNGTEPLEKYPSYNRTWSLLYNFLHRLEVTAAQEETLEQPPENPVPEAVPATEEKA